MSADSNSLVPLADLIEVMFDFRGRTPKKLGLEWGGDIPALSALNVKDGRITLKDANLGDEELYTRWMTRGDCEEGDVLFTTEAPLGNVAQVPDSRRYILSQRVILLRAKTAVCSNDYLSQALRSPFFKDTLLRHATGSTAQGIKVSTLMKLKVPVLERDAQDVVARLLSTSDDCIAATRRLNRHKRDLRRGLLQQLLTGERRFPEFRDEPWVERHFGDILTESRIPGSHGATAKKLSIRLYGKGLYLRTDNRDGSEQTQYYRRSAGQLVYSKLDFLNGAFGIVPPDLDGYESTLDVPAFDIADDTDPRWLLYLLTYEGFYKRQLGLAHGGRKARRVNPDAFLGIAMPMPARTEQRRIADTLEAVDREIELLTDLHGALQKQKKGLMQQLLTGKVRVPESMLKVQTQ